MEFICRQVPGIKFLDDNQFCPTTEHRKTRFEHDKLYILLKKGFTEEIQELADENKIQKRLQLMFTALC